MLSHVCPHTAVYVSSYCCICVLTLLCVCPHTAVYVSSYCCIYVLILLYICPHTAVYVSAYCYIYVSTYGYICVPYCNICVFKYTGLAICACMQSYVCVLILLHVSPFCYICVLILLNMCPQVKRSGYLRLHAILYVCPHTDIHVFYFVRSVLLTQ
jgi:hypothetical protein